MIRLTDLRPNLEKSLSFLVMMMRMQNWVCVVSHMVVPTKGKKIRKKRMMGVR